MKTNRFFVCCLMAGALASAASRSRSECFSIALPAPYDRVLEAIREVSSDAVIHGAAQYESETGIQGASAADSSPAFPQWTGSGVALFKIRSKTIAPTNFKGSRDVGTVTLRYVVEPIGPNETRLTIDAVFVEDSRHGRHPSQGMVEMAEFAEVAQKLKHSDRTAARQQAQVSASRED